jgi:polysaccharide biosynthesis transport protein
LLTSLDSALRSPTECLDMLGVRGIGLLPRIAGWRSRRIADCIVNEGMPRDAVRSIVEILRAARTEGKTRSIAITSSVPHEGKSVLAVWLARVSAMIGLKVLLIDADLRRPAVAKYLKLEDESVRASRDVTTGDKLADLRRVDPLTGLHYLTCKIGADKVQGIASLEGVERLIQEAGAVYDLIVVDGAPILAAPESLSICQMTDGVIFAVRWGITPPRQARQALSMLRPTRAHLIGAVVTRADVKRHQKYAYGDVGEVYYRHKAYYRA